MVQVCERPGDLHIPVNIAKDQEERNNMIENSQDVARYFGLEEHEQDRVSRQLYKATDCGAWLQFIDDGVMVGTIVEGADVEPESITLTFPFTENDFNAAIQTLEEQAAEIWHEWNE
jgi:hypothetical protein